MTGRVLDLRVGSRIMYKGDPHTVVELEGTTVVLESQGYYTRVHAPSLVGWAFPLPRRRLDDETEAEAVDDSAGQVKLASIEPSEREQVEREAEVYQRLVIGAEGTALGRRYEEAAAELGVSPRTVRRRVDLLESHGTAGLVDDRRVAARPAGQFAVWDEACVEVLESMTYRSNPPVRQVIRLAGKECARRDPSARIPSASTAYRRVKMLSKGLYTFGSAKQRRSRAEAPHGVMGRLRADRPGQFVELDTTRLDVFALDEVTGQWMNTELTVAIDVYSRCIVGLRLAPVSTNSQVVASVLYQTVTEQHWGPEPDEPLSGLDLSKDAGQVVEDRTPGTLPDTIVVDHGSVYLSEHTRSVCRRLGINIQPATPHKPTDKAVVERFFRTLREGLLVELPGYKGPDVHSRGQGVEKTGFYYVRELEQIIREWVGIYHHTPHAGLCDPRLPGVDLSPAEMYARGLSSSGVLRLAASEDLRMEFLEVQWRRIHHYGVQIDGRRYKGPVLLPYVNRESRHGGRHAGRWPILVDPDDVRTVFFQDPETGRWCPLEWDEADGLTAPMSTYAAEYVRQVSQVEGRHVDPGTALHDLLDRHSKGATKGRREKNLARRVGASAQDVPTPALQAPSPPVAGDEPEAAEVVDLTTHLEARSKRPIRDDTDVFAAYYDAHPDQDALEVLE